MAHDCKKMLSELSDYIDGELADELCQQLEEHLADCENCRIMLDSLTKTVRIYCEGKEQPLPDAVRSSLRETLERKWRGSKSSPSDSKDSPG